MSETRPEDPERLLEQAHWLRRLARGLLRDESAADDLVQDTWVAALRAKPAARAEELRAWMSVVARNFARRRRRDAGLRTAHEPRGARAEALEGPDAIAARVELQRKLAEALLALEEPGRSALVLRYLDGLPAHEVARRLCISPEAARQRIARGLARLRERLDRQHAGGRAGWMGALLPLAEAPIGSITGGMLLMGTKSKVAIAVLTAVLGLWLWRGALGPGALEPGSAPANELPALPDPAAESAVPLPLEGAQEDSRSAVVPPSAASRAADPAPANVLRGIVLDPRNRPVEGARIVAASSLSYDYQTLDLSIAPRTEQAGEARSRADGRFELELDPARLYQVTVDKPGYAQATLGRRQPGETVTVHLPYGAALEGRVTQGEAHLPVAGARVRCFLRSNDSPDGARFEQSGTSAADGSFRLDTLPPGILFLEASAPGLPGSGWIEVHPEAGKTVTQDVHLSAKHWFRGRVLDALTRVPIAGAELATIWVMRNTVATDAGGNFTLPLDPGSDGQIYVRAAGYGFRNAPQSAGTRATGADGLEILLEPARKASGRVIDEQGRPIAGAYVAACGTDFGEVQRHDWVATTSDAQGRYAIADLRPDLQHSLFVRAQGFGSSVYEFPAAERTQAVLELADVVLRPAGSISGRVVDENGRPLPDLDVQLRGTNADRGRWDARGGQFLDNYIGERTGRTDDRGAFTFDELAGGEYVVELHRDGHQAEGRQSLTLKPGERRSGLELSLASGVTLAGHVRNRAGEPVRGVYVSIEPTGPGLSDCDVQTGLDGRFSARGVVPGTYRIQLWPPSPDPDAPEARFHVHGVFEGQQADGRELELVIEEGVWLAGVVVEADGTPVAGVSIRAFESGSEYRSTGQTDAQGRFRIAVERDKALEVEAQRQPRIVPGERGRMVDANEGGVGRASHVFGGGADLRIVLPAR